MAQLSPIAIFSPSVARQQLAIAKDWNYIDGWLTTKFNGKSAPPFERNNDTLKALLALATLNESADEECELLLKVEARTIQELESKLAVSSEKGLFQSIIEEFTHEGHVSLEALIIADVLLNQPLADVEQLAQEVLELHVTLFTLDQASNRLENLHKQLDTELEQINHMVNELQTGTYQASSELSKQTLEYQRRSKALAAKLPELKNRIAFLSAGLGGPKLTIRELELEEETFKTLMVTVKSLEAQNKYYCGLPYDTDLARLELETLRAEFTQIKRQRDEMFERLIERESPQKSRA